MREAEFQIENAILRRVIVPLVEPFRISNGSVAHKESIIIELQSEGHIGYGEASPMSGSFYSPETPETTWNALANDLVPDLFTRRLDNPVRYAELLDAYSREPFARAGIEGAVWHLAASRLDTTIAAMLGSPAGDIPSGLAVGIYDTIEELVARIAQYLENGYRRTKIKIMPGWDLEPLRAVRERFGAIPLMVDANASYRWPEHRETLHALDAFDLMMIEQPLAAGAFGELAELAREIRTPVCVDESADSLDSLEEIIRNHSASIINIKVQRVGGLWNAKRMHDRAVEAGLTCWLGTMPELGIASAQALAIATLPGFAFPTDIEASARWFVDDITDPPISITPNGMLIVPDRGPMNYDVHMENILRYSVETKTFSR